jgi:hypothetical protein
LSKIGIYEVAEMSESKQSIKKEWKRPFPIISSIICLVGGVLFFWSIDQIAVGSFDAIGRMLLGVLFGFMVVFGAIIGPKRQRSGPLLCLIAGIFFPLVCWIPRWYGSVPCITFSPIFLSGVIVTLGGSVVGLIGAILNKRKQKRVEH